MLYSTVKRVTLDCRVCSYSHDYLTFPHILCIYIPTQSFLPLNGLSFAYSSKPANYLLFQFTGRLTLVTWNWLPLALKCHRWVRCRGRLIITGVIGRNIHASLSHIMRKTRVLPAPHDVSPHDLCGACEKHAWSVSWIMCPNTAKRNLEEVWVCLD